MPSKIINNKIIWNGKIRNVVRLLQKIKPYVWTVDQKAIKKHANDSQNVYFGYGSIMFTLYPKQKFDLDNLSIK